MAETNYYMSHTGAELDEAIRKVLSGELNVPLQEKTATPTTSSQIILPDSSYKGLSKVTVNAIPQSYTDEVYDEGYAKGLEDATPTLQSKTVTPSTNQQTVSPDNGYDGLSKVVVSAIPQSYTDGIYEQGYLAGQESLKTLLLLHGESVTDSSTYARTIANSGVTVSTAQSKFGGKSLYFNGSSSLSVSLPAAGDITVDFWAYTTAFNTDYPTPFAWGSGSCRGTYMHICRSSTEFGETGQNSSGDPSIATSAVTANAWHHFALVRTGGYTNGYIDGKSVGNITSQTISNDTMILGYLPGVQSITRFTGYIDEFRVSSVARWNTNFNVPTQAYN